jgi:hypothetical protein
MKDLVIYHVQTSAPHPLQEGYIWFPEQSYQSINNEEAYLDAMSYYKTLKNRGIIARIMKETITNEVITDDNMDY